MPTAVITGSSRGLGRATALRFARDGYDIAVNYHTSEAEAEAVAERAREHGVEAVVVGADVSEYDDAERLVETAADAFGGIDHLVNNAGIDQHVYTDSLSPEDFDRVSDVNVNSAFNCTKAARTYLYDSDDDPSVVNLSSILAFTGAPVECHYAASKKERELAAIPRDRYGQPEDIAEAAAYLRDAGFVTGETLHVNGGERMQ
ncbi:short-chain dehydrogenase [Halobacteriales archaeon SW_6_65_46]|nr:MAG: short-chain dehydrogenase [Halobacteriales archaeon SW_6_65_46]